MLGLGGLALRQQAGAEHLLPGLDPADVARIELARGREQVVLARRLDTGAWEILSAADAPGDAVRIAAMLERLAALKAKPTPAGTAAPAREPLALRLSDAAGRELGQAAFWDGEARRLPGGPRLAIDRAPALPLWPSAWTSLSPPKIDVSRIEAVERITPAGAEPLPPAAVGEVARTLQSLSARDFTAGASVDWRGARQFRVYLADGSTLDLQQVADGDGRTFLRLTSDRMTDVRAVRRYAFRVKAPLP